MKPALPIRTYCPLFQILSLTLFVLLTYHSRAYTEDFRGRVTRVIDGDTVEVFYKKKPVRVRFFGIDAPERDQPFGKKATQFLVDLVDGKEVEVIVKSKDNYGRTIGVLYLPSSLHSVNETLLAEGLAWWYTRFAKHAHNYKRLQAQARAKSIGLWSIPTSIPPWKWKRSR